VAKHGRIFPHSFPEPVTENKDDARLGVGHSVRARFSAQRSQLGDRGCDDAAGQGFAVGFSTGRSLYG